MDFIDLKAQQARIRSDVNARIQTVLDHGRYIMGPEVLELEASLAGYTGATHCVTCSNGTDALVMALMAAGIGAGDAVFVPSFTFVATAEAVSAVGAVPLFVDVDPKTANLDPEALKQCIEAYQNGKGPSPQTPLDLRPRAIIAVDLFGLPAAYPSLRKIAAAHNLILIGDGAQAFGAQQEGQRVGRLAPITTTSFFPAKPLGCYGDGGAIFTTDDHTAEILRSLRVHGKGAYKYENVRVGMNGRLDTIQAAVLLAKLSIFDDELERREAAAKRYDALLSQDVALLARPDGHQSAWAQYTFRVDPNRRTAIQSALKAEGIPTMVYYPNPLHLQKVYAPLGYVPGSLPHTEALAASVLSLPMHPYLDANTQTHIATALRAQL